MSEPAAIPKNPYVGPRPFTRTDPLFGRDVEKIELLNILISERIVLLYSPSGAGKTSLIQAGLVPELKTERFRALPTIRVNRVPPDAGDPVSANRYVASAIRSLEEGRTGPPRIPAAELTGLTLNGYLERLEAGGNANSGESADPFVLIFDQFEEILTVDPADVRVKEAFFAEVGAALAPRHRWALFAMREEYVASLDPYLRHIPTRLATTFRLGLLEHPAAKDAIQKPAAKRRVAFTDPAADALIADLTAVKLPDGTMHLGALPFVEPVQLQVVCLQFWNSLPWGTLPIRDGDPQIEAGHVAEYARVDDALAAYYADKVQEIAADAGGDAPNVLERQIREWIETNLITERGTRAQLRVGAERGQTLPRNVINTLANAYLIRSEGRADDRWYELAHDRLVRPVQESNAAWLETSLAALAASYDEDLEKIAAATATADPNVREREIREWIETNLITERGTRAQLRVGAEREQTLAEDAIQALVASTLIRRGGRGDDRWYELAHDRLLPPIQDSNAKWLDAHLHEVQLRARQWDKSDRRPELLPRGADLKQAVAWQKANAPVLPARERKLLADFVEAGKREQGRRSQIQLLLGLVILGAIGALVLLADTYLDRQAEAAAVEANRQAEAARAQVLAQQERSASLANLAAVQLRTGDVDLGLLLAVEAVAASDTVEAQRVLLEALSARPGLVAILGRQASMPTTIAVNRQGSIAASAGCAVEALGCQVGEIRLWDLVRRQPLALDPASQEIGEVRSLAFHPEEPLLAAGTADQGVLLLDSTTGQPLDPPAIGDERSVSSVAFSDDGQTLAIGSASGTIEFWDTQTWERQGPARTGHLGAVTALVFGQGGALVSGGGDGVVLVWHDGDIRLRCGATPIGSDCEAIGPQGTPEAGAGDDEGELVPVQGGVLPMAGPIQSLSVSPDGRWLASGTANGTLTIWDAESGRWRSQFQGEPVPVLSVAFDQTGSSLAAVQQDRATLLWDLADREQSESVLATGSFSAAAFVPDGDRFVAGDPMGEVAIWDLTQTSAFARELDTGSAVQTIAWSPDGATLATGEADGTLRLWDAGDAGTPETLMAAEQAISSVAYRPDGGALALSAAVVELWDVGTARRIAALSIGESRAVNAVAFSPDGQTLAGGGQDGAILLWTLADPGAEPAILGRHSNPVHTVAFSPNGEMLASGGADRTVRLWALGQPDAAPIVLSGRDVIASVAFGPNGRTLAAGGFNGNVSLWDLNRPLGGSAIPAVLAGQVGQINAVAFSPDGRLLAAGGEDGSVQVWDVATRGSIGTLTGHGASVLTVSFAAGDALASGGEDGSAIVWSLGLKSMQQDACRLVNRSLSREEWQELAPDQPYLAACASNLGEGTPAATAAAGEPNQATP